MGFAIACTSRFSDKAKAIVSKGPFPVIAAALCSLGTCLTFYGFSSGTAPVVIGGITAGLGFCGLLVSCVSQITVPMTLAERNKMVCWGLGLAVVVQAILALSLEFVRGVLLCCLPFAALALCLAAAKRQVTCREQVMQATAGEQTFPRGHTTVVASCFLGVGLLSGIVGFSLDELAPSDYSMWMQVSGMLGSAIACALFALLTRKNPEGPYIFLPVLLGTSAVLLLVTSSAGSGLGADAVFVARQAVDAFSFALGTCVCLETARIEPGRPMRPALLVSLLAASLLTGIILGGALLSVAGISMTTFVVLTVTLVYSALVGLGLSTQQRDGQNRVVVTSSADIERIACAQARALVEDGGKLTPREREILPLLIQHRTLESIADELGVSRNTVKSHVKHIYEKLGVDTRQQLQDKAAAKTINL